MQPSPSSTSKSSTQYRLTQYSHGAGCSCKISPKVLDTILAAAGSQLPDSRLWVGNNSRDDAAVFELNAQQGVVSTTDFFMPIVDDAYDFGRIAATNAISDIYAMGATPLMAIAILGWPIDKLPAEVAGEVIRGARSVCDAANIALAGGHSIDTPEPIFGLAVTGIVQKERIKRNDTAQVGDKLYLTKPLGIGLLTTAEKQNKLKPEDKGVACELMCTLNKIGADFAGIAGVHAMTDVTGFGLLGHLVEMADGSNLTAVLNYSAIPHLDSTDYYLAQGCIPGGTERNFDSYGHRIAPLAAQQKQLLCDPQTSGGLLVAVAPAAEQTFLSVAASQGLNLQPIGQFNSAREFAVEVLSA